MTIDEFMAANAATPQAYEATADALVQRILAAFEAHPEAAEITDPFALFKVPGFTCDGLQPSLFQASWALAKARKIFAAKRAP